MTLDDIATAIPAQVVTKRLQFNQTVQRPQGSPVAQALNLMRDTPMTTKAP